MKNILKKIAITICSVNFIFFGILKTLHMHFTGFTLQDLLKDYDLCKLTFFFFSASVGYTTVLGISQFLSGLFILLPKLRVFGLFSCLAIQFNICLLNIFYSFGYLITFYNIILLTVLIYLSMNYAKKIYYSFSN